MSTSYVPFQPVPLIRKESTAFDQVYGGYRRRPNTICLNIQWTPIVNRSNTYLWNGHDIDNRKLKRETCFDINTMREQRQSRAMTPPSSDYTDAYLSAFAPKIIPTRRIYRLTTPVFANVAPIPFRPPETHLSTNTSIRTSQTRSNNLHTNQTSNSFDKIILPSPNTNTTNSSKFTPDTSTKYEPFSYTQSSASQTQTFNSNYSTSFPNKTTIHTSSLPSSSTIPTTDQPESSYENTNTFIPPQSFPSYSSSTITTSSSSSSLSSSPPPPATYRPSVPFQSAPLPFSNDIQQSSTNKQTVLPSLDSDKLINRPETLLFQHDEDIRSSYNEKNSPMITPLLESPITRIESKIDPQYKLTEELSIDSSKPIAIIENTNGKYDTLINQISDILSTVSPLSSTISSMSPGKSVLDYEFTADGSPILHHKHIELQSSQLSTTPVKNTNIQRGKARYLIREDSYDKIVTAITDLDNELTPPPDIQKLTTRIDEEENESITPTGEAYQTLSSIEQIIEKAKILSSDDHYISSSSDEKQEETEILRIHKHQLSPLNETKLDEKKSINIQTPIEASLDNTQFIQQQTSLLFNVSDDKDMQEDISRSFDETISRKNNEKYALSDETDLTEENDETSSYQSFTEESSSLETPITILKKKRLIKDEIIPLVEQPISTLSFNEQVIIDDQVNPPTSINRKVNLKNFTEQDHQKMIVEEQTLPFNVMDHQFIASDSIESQINVVKRQIKSSSPLEKSSSYSDSVDRQTPPSDLNESRSSSDEPISDSRSSSNINDKKSTIVIIKQNIDQQMQEIEPNTNKTYTQFIDDTANEAKTSSIQSTDLSLLPVIISPIDTLTDSISTRYISCDVYYGYLGEHIQSIANQSDIDTDNTKISLFTSLRQTIATPVTPLIETIQCAISTMRTITVAQSLKDENKMIDHSPNDTELAITVSTNSKEVINEDETQIDKNKQIVHPFEESNTIIKDLHDTVTEAVQTIVSNLQEDEQKILSIPDIEHLKQISEELISNEDVKDLTTLKSIQFNDNIDSLGEKLDDHSTNKIESTSSSLFDSIQEKLSDTITTLTETVQNVISTDISSDQIETAAERNRPSSSLNTLHQTSTDNLVDTSISLTSQITVAAPIYENIEQISSDTDACILDQTENQNNVIVKSLPSEIPTLLSEKDKMTENIIIQNDKQMSTENIVLPKYMNTASIQEITDKEAMPFEIAETIPVDQKLENFVCAEDETIERIVLTSIVQDDKQILITNAISSEKKDTTDKEETTQIEFGSMKSVDVTNSKQTTDELKTSLDDNLHPLDITSTNDQCQILTLQNIELYSNDKLQEKEKISSTTLQSQISNNEILQPTSAQRSSNAVLLQDYITNTEKTTTYVSSIDSITSQLTTAILETDALASINNTDHKIILDIIQELINSITDTNVSLLEKNSKETNQEILISDSDHTKLIVPQINDIMQESTTEIDSDSASIKTEIENIPSKPSTDISDSSPSNTEPDSIELIHALQGHSIIHPPNSSEQLFNPHEKSSSSITSSPITSSDRYVSYAIHEMGDSSQERLPSIPISADLPIHKNLLSEPIIVANQPILKEDDLTEFDATDNLTSFTDDILLQKHYTSTINTQQDLDASSTDDDVDDDDEFEHNVLTDTHHIIDKVTQPINSLITNEEFYQRYELATTPSSNDGSLSSRQNPDDIYLIPGYPGLWRPSPINDNTNLSIVHDEDNDRKAVAHISANILTSDSTRRPLVFQHYQDQKPNLTHTEDLSNTTDIFNRQLNEYPFDISESDSYQTCPSSLSKQLKLNEIKKSEDDDEENDDEEHQSSPDENIFLIRERERGVSLPITVKIDCNDIALRLSASTPIDSQLYSTIQHNLSSPSTFSEPLLSRRTDSSDQISSSSLSNNGIDQQKLPSWLNTINTITTTIEGSDGPLEARITLLKSAKGPINISECHPQGNYIIIDNTSRSKNIDLINWTICQENDNGEKLYFTFPDNYLLRPNHSVKILTKTNQSEQINDDLIASSISSWYNGPNIITALINPDGKNCATLTKNTIIS